MNLDVEELKTIRSDKRTANKREVNATA